MYVINWNSFTLQPLVTMKVYQYTNSLPKFSNAVVTIGTFDGVHQGHRQILHQLKQEAASIGGETVIITFHPHPRNIINKSGDEIRLLNTMAERIELIEKEGIDLLVIVAFTDAFSRLTAEEYVEHFLIENFQPKVVIIGYDHRFGQGRKGDYHRMEEYSTKGFFELREIPAELIHNNTVSSTRIRNSLRAGEVSTANLLLGYDYFFEGMVVHGSKIGRTLGYPTANIMLHDTEKLVPADGIYVVRVNVGEELFDGMMSIGVRPTVDGQNRVIEVNIFDFNKDIYDQTIRVYLVEYLRPEWKFENLDSLKNQIDKDKQNSLRILKR